MANAIENDVALDPMHVGALGSRAQLPYRIASRTRSNSFGFGGTGASMVIATPAASYGRRGPGEVRSSAGEALEEAARLAELLR